MNTTRLEVRQAHTKLTDEAAAVADLLAQLQPQEAAVVLFFCSPHFDLAKLGRAFADSFAAPLVGCTTAGQIGRAGYVDGGITAVSLVSTELRVVPYVISNLSDSAESAEIGYRAAVELARNKAKNAFALLLIDGLSSSEERVAAVLFEALGDVPLIGGSAADDLTNAGTYVYYDGEFRSGAAVLALFDTTLPFVTFKVQHAVPGPKKLVITEADADQRIVFEINGKPAAPEYARQIGIELGELTPAVCAQNPLLLTIENQHFVRAVRMVNANGSLSFACAVEVGLVLTIGVASSALTALREAFDKMNSVIHHPAVVLGFDCVSRRREFERLGEADAIGSFLAAQKVVGFCTYGEQFDSLHMNQTFTAIALGDG